MMLAGALAAAGVLGAVWWYSRRSGKHLRPEVCDRCGKSRELLDEESEDVHLAEGQRLEEQHGSADYHVWWCGSCEAGVVLRQPLLTRPKRINCEKCGRDTATEISQTLQSATSTQGGEFRIHLSCRSCGHSQRFWRYTPRTGLRP